MKTTPTPHPATILEGLNKRVFYIAQPFIRLSGYIILGLLAYLQLFFQAFGSNQAGFATWLAAYLAYILLLEWLRRKLPIFYDTPGFRLIRILYNLVMFTWLLVILPQPEPVLVFLFAIPLLSAAIYFRNMPWIQLLVWGLVGTGLLIDGRMVYLHEPYTAVQVASILVALGAGSIGIRSLYNTTPAKFGDLSELAREMHEILDLDQLLESILQTCIQLSKAHRALVFVVNPDNQRYITHASQGFTLLPSCSIEDFVRKCAVLGTGKNFREVDMLKAFGGRSIYATFFDCRPRSVLAFPIFTRDRKILGVLNLTSDQPNQFDPAVQNQLLQFSELLGSAVENCLIYRKACINEAKDRNASPHLFEAMDEAELGEILIQEAQRLIPVAEAVVLHKYQTLASNPDTDNPRGEELCLWTASYSNELGKSRMKSGIGIAGHALDLQESILVQDVEIHPWFIKSAQPVSFRSLVVAPLIDPVNRQVYGTISIHNSSPRAFHSQDEIELLSLAYQGARTLTQIKAYQHWREQGWLFKKIFDEAGKFTIDAGIKELCAQIVHAALQALPFGMARIRILDPKTNLLTTFATASATQRNGDEQAGKPIPLDVLQPFFCQEFRAARTYLIPHDNEQWEQVAEEYFFIADELREKHTGWRAYDAFLIPLWTQASQLLGLLTLDVPTSGMQPTREVIEEASIFANTAAWAIDLAMAHQRMLAEQARTMALVSSISEKLAKSKEIRAIGEVAVQVGVNILGVEGCTFLLVNGDELELTNSNFLSETRYIGRKKSISKKPGYGLQAYVAATGEPLFYPDESYKDHPAWAGDSDHLEHLPSHNVKSLIIMPVKSSSGDILGVISVENKLVEGEIEAFDQEDFHWLAYFAGELGKAIEVVKRYETIEKREREGLEDDVHELINYYHSGVVLFLDVALEQLERGKIEEARQHFRKISDRAYTTVNELKTIHTSMRAKYLELEELSQSLRRMAESWSDRVSPYDRRITIAVDCPEKVEMPEILRNTLVRIASNAVSNCVKYSGALQDPTIQIEILVEVNDGHLILQVKDNGRGAERIEAGYGISRMRQLVEQLCKANVPTKLSIVSKVGKGTTVKVLAHFNDRGK